VASGRDTEDSEESVQGREGEEGMNCIQQSIESDMTAKDVLQSLKNGIGTGYGNIFIPEFTFADLRIDGIFIDTDKRRIRGIEVKVSRADFKADEKWQLYTQFTSDLSIACPKGLIQKDEVPSPFGLIWCEKEFIPAEKMWDKKERTNYFAHWVKKPKRFNNNGLAWFWRYTEILETEFKRHSVNW
jgi:hypothetical protein